ncbi:hypothetical protein V8F20_009497 [Naviculisporaceae sp. PSN 640]
MKSLLAALLLAPLPFALAGYNWDIIDYGVVDTFKWSRPYPDDGTDPGGFHLNCREKRTLHAKMYKLRDLHEEPPLGLKPWAHAIEDFLSKRDYPGSWDGVDHKGEDREIVMMEYKDVPGPVRHWIEQQQLDEDQSNPKRWLYGVFEKPKKEGEEITATAPPLGEATVTVNEHGHEVQKVVHLADKDKIVVFPGSSVYEILPLWVAHGSSCDRDFLDLSKYKHQAIDHCVIGWVTDHTKPQRDLNRRDMRFDVEAMLVTETEEGKYARQMWEKMHRAVKRNQRRMDKEERLRIKKEMEREGSGHIRDEL